MGFLSDLFSGVANGAVKSADRGGPVISGVRHIENLCAELGWGIDGRVGENGIVLHFKDTLFGVRQLLITPSGNSDLVVFSAFSPAQFPANNVPAALAYYLLVRNQQAFFHSWQVSENDNGTVSFAVWYSTGVGALRPGVFKTICEAMCQDVYELDAKLRQAGLL